MRRASAEAPIRLAEIARLEGEHARRFADLVVLPATPNAADRLERIHVSEVRRLLDAAGIDWGRVDLAGGDVTVRPAVARVGDPSSGSAASGRIQRRFETAVESTSVAPTGGRFRSLNEAIADSDRPTVAAIAARIVRHWTLEGLDLDAILIDVDLAPLDRLPADVETCRLSVIAGTLTDLIHVKVEGVDAVGRRPSVLVPVEVRRLAEVPVAIASIGAGRPVQGLGVDVALERRPVRPSLLADPRILVDVRAVADRKTRRGLSSGEVLTRDLLVPAKVIDRGDEVTVESRIGGYRITYKAVATTDGHTDGRVTCRAIDGDRTALFEARVVGAGLVQLASPVQ